MLTQLPPAFSLTFAIDQQLEPSNNMTADMETQPEMDENGLPGPGAPTPLSALEVRLEQNHDFAMHFLDALLTPSDRDLRV